MTDHDRPAPPDQREDWRGDFDSARERTLDHWSAATASERLQWLEDALAFAHRMGALANRDQE